MENRDDPLFEFLRFFNEDIKINFQENSNDLFTIIKKNARDYLTNYIDNILDNIVHKFDKSMILAIIIFDKYDWWMFPLYNLNQQMIVKLINNISSMSKEEARKYINNFVIKFCSKNNYECLKKIKNNLNGKYFKNRKEIFKDAFQAHKQKKYTLSINTLAPQLEGILWRWGWNNVSKKEIQEEQGSIEKAFGKKLRYNENFIKKIKNIDKVESNNSLSTLAEKTNIRKQYNLYKVRKFFKGELDKANEQFEDIHPERYNDLDLNRNFIAHGLYNNYTGNQAEVNSLKLFLLLNILNKLIMKFEKDTNSI